MLATLPDDGNRYEIIDRWRPADDRPEILTERLEWRPDDARTPLTIDLGRR
jgi:hypothetical protein